MMSQLNYIVVAVVCVVVVANVDVVALLVVTDHNIFCFCQ